MNITDKPTFSVGETVAIVRGGHSRGSVRLAKIDRETKLYWVIGDAKFRKADLVQPGGSAWTFSARIMKADDPVAIRNIEEQNRWIGFSRAMQAVDALRTDRDNPAAVREVIAKAEAYLKIIEKEQP